MSVSGVALAELIALIGYQPSYMIAPHFYKITFAIGAAFAFFATAGIVLLFEALRTEPLTFEESGDFIERPPCRKRLFGPLKVVSWRRL